MAGRPPRRERASAVDGPPVAPAAPAARGRRSGPEPAARDVVVIGASAGGGEALAELVRHVPADIPAALFVVLQIPDTRRGAVPASLMRAGALPARHPADGETIRHGHIYVAPPGFHLVVEPGCVRLLAGPKENGLRPSIDPLFRSAARACDGRVAGIVLSGTLDGGTAGLLAIKRAGGVAIVQEPQEALHSSMPRSALEHVEVDYCLTVAEIGPLLVQLATATTTPLIPQPAA